MQSIMFISLVITLVMEFYHVSCFEFPLSFTEESVPYEESSLRNITVRIASVHMNGKNINKKVKNLMFAEFLPESEFSHIVRKKNIT